MFPSTSSSSSPSASPLFHGFPGHVNSRKLLLYTPLHQSPDMAAAPVTAKGHDPSETYAGESSFDANVVMILSVLLCALICALGLNSIIRCALRCSSRVGTESGSNVSARLANTGIKRKALKTFPTITYSPASKVLSGLDSECVICLSEFGPGERIRVLPKCNHGFHIRCIDRWLMSHSSCPTCRHCLLETCQKIVGCQAAGSSEPPRPPPPSPPQGRIVQLEPEGLIRDYRSS